MKKQLCLLSWSVALIASLMLPSRAHAQTASISGTVTDSSGAAVPGASIELRNTATGATRTVVTDNQGRYSVPELNIGAYELRGSKTGFETTVRSGITLTVGARRAWIFNSPSGRRPKR